MKKELKEQAKTWAGSSNGYLLISTGYRRFLLPFDKGMQFLDALNHAKVVRIPFNEPCAIEPEELSNIETTMMNETQVEAIYISNVLSIPHKEAIKMLLEKTDEPDA